MSESSRERPTDPVGAAAPPSPEHAYFDQALRTLLNVHQEQLRMFSELHDPHGALGRLNANVELMIRETRTALGRIGSLEGRVAELERRMDAREAADGAFG